MENRSKVVLADLPPIIKGKTGWPWDVLSDPLPEALPDGRPWPKISIVTPSFNQGKFLEETIRSVLLQNYPNLEYIIIDGKSVDNSVEIIHYYEPWLDYWISEKDHGQAEAINKGWQVATGEIMAWLNSDDIYLPNVLSTIALNINIEKGKYLVFGDVYLTDEVNNILDTWKGKFSNRNELIRFWDFWYARKGTCWIMQPATFIHRYALEKSGFLDETIYHGMDYDLWIRLSKNFSFNYINQVLATYRIHPDSKTVANSKQHQEAIAISRRYWGSPYKKQFWVNSFSLLKFNIVKRSEEYYKKAETYWQVNNPLISLCYILMSILVFIPNLRKASHITLTMRNILGNNLYEKIKELTIRSIEQEK